jgi:serine/threonine protein kinase
MLTLDPNKRITAKEALQHQYFQTSPEPCDPSLLPLPKSTMEPPTKKMKASGGDNI